MIHPFNKAFIAACKELLSPLGFQSNGKYFFRIVNDIYQDLSLKRYSDGVTYDVFFGITPFCLGAETVSKDGTSVFPLAHFAQLPPYENDKTEEQFHETAVKLVTLISTHIIPLFELTLDIESIFDVWNRISFDMWSHSNLRDIYIIDPSQIMMALALGDYCFAEKGLRQRVDLGLDLDVETRDLKYIELLDRVHDRDFEYVERFIKKNERKSRITLGLEAE
jgi:hypothetical protein